MGHESLLPGQYHLQPGGHGTGAHHQSQPAGGPVWTRGHDRHQPPERTPHLLSGRSESAARGPGREHASALEHAALPAPPGSPHPGRATGHRRLPVHRRTAFPAETEGVVTFQVNNQKIQCNVKYDTGWVNLDLSRVSAIFAISSPMQIRRIGNIVHIRGAVKTKDNTTFIGGWDDYWNIGTFPDSRFNPSQDETFVTQSSKKQRCTVQVKKGGFIWVGRFTDSNSSGQYTMPKDLWIPVALTYFVD